MSGAEHPRDAATRWFAERRKGEIDQPAFEAWMDAAPEHREAYGAIERAWGAAGAVRSDPRILARRQAMLKTAGRRRWIAGALAAGFALALVGALAGSQYQAAPKPLATQAFRTDVGQRSTVTLPDGTVVTLNTDTVVRTRASRDRRLVYLDKGQAFFKVAKDRHHPFVVSAAGRTVTALGTAFDVRVDRGVLKVVLVEGKVRVETPVPAAPRSPAAPRTPQVQATEMVAGSQLVAPDDADWRLTRTNVVRETSWINGQIIFDNRPLGQVVEELNRYSDQKMRVSGEALAARPISGTFRPGDLHGFAVALEAYRLARVEGEDERELRIVPIQ